MTPLFAEIEPLLRHHLKGNALNRIETVHTRSDNRGGLLRLLLASGGSVIVKVWRLRNFKEQLKSFAYLSNGRREWRVHRFIYKAGIQAPAPLAFYQMMMPEGIRCELMAIEDLGVTCQGLPYLKQLIAHGHEVDIISFENSLIELTNQFIKLRILDIDHQLNNFVVDAQGRLMRIDFECARKHPLGVMPRKEYAEMLSRLITSHIYAVQPDVGRSVRFAEQLYKKLDARHWIKEMVHNSVNDKLARQLASGGVNTTVSLPL